MTPETIDRGLAFLSWLWLTTVITWILTAAFGSAAFAVLASIATLITIAVFSCGSVFYLISRKRS